MSTLNLRASKKTKHTPAGDIPVDWGWSELTKVAKIQTGLSKSSSRRGEFIRLPYLRVANVQDGHFNLSEIKEIDVPKDSVDRYSIKKGDVLLTEGGDYDKLGRGAIWQGQISPCVHQNHIFVVRPNEELLDTRFFAYQSSGPRGRAYFQSCAKQSTNLASINSSQLKEFPAFLPPLPEQRKIADILGTWDTALEKIDALIAVKTRRKQALMQQLLFRAVEHTRTIHTQHRLGDIAKRITRKNHKADNNVLTISARHGLVSQKKYFNRSVAGKDLSKYYLIKKGEFAYNRSAAKGYPCGAIKRLEKYDEGVVSTLYLCFSVINQNKASSDYLCHYFESGFMNRGLKAIAKEGARAHGLLNVTASDFLDLDILLPDIQTQRQIAQVLNTADKELRLLEEQRTALEQQKRGLMQQLLAGKIRVPI